MVLLIPGSEGAQRVQIGEMPKKATCIYDPCPARFQNIRAGQGTIFKHAAD